MSQAQTGMIGGAAQGASAGAAFGPWGAVIGGVLGGIGGLMGGSAADEALKYQRKAAKFEKRSKLQAEALNRRNMLRDARIQQANAIAFAASEEGGLLSSGSQGARSSATSQLGFNLGYMSNQNVLQQAITKNLEKAGQYSNKAADTFGLVNTLAGAAGALGSRIPKTPSAPTSSLYRPTIGGYQPAASPTASFGLTAILDQQLTSPPSR